MLLNESYHDGFKNASSNEPYGHDLSNAFSRGIAFCFAMIIIIAVSSNILLITTIISVRKLYSFMHVFIVNMAISDLITAIGTIPFDVEYMVKGYFSGSNIACGIMQTTFLISLPSSVLSLSLITLERFISIVFPLREIVTKRSVVAALMGTWGYTLIVALFPMMYSRCAVSVVNGNCFLWYPIEYQFFQLVVNFLIPIAFIIGVYMKLFLIAYRQANKTAWVAEKLGDEFSCTVSLTSLDIKVSKSASKNLRKISRHVMSSLSRNIKASKRIALLVGVFLICWLSYIIIVMLNSICHCHRREVIWIANVINYSSSAINPVLYGLLDKNIRREVINKLKKLKQACLSCVRDDYIWMKAHCDVIISSKWQVGGENTILVSDVKTNYGHMYKDVIKIWFVYDKFINNWSHGVWLLNEKASQLMVSKSSYSFILHVCLFFVFPVIENDFTFVNLNWFWYLLFQSIL